MSNQELAAFFLALTCLLLAAHGCGRVAEWMRWPRVIGEIGAGIALGPTLFGRLAPELWGSLFDAFAGEKMLLAGFHWIGLVLLMFISGLRVRGDLDADERRSLPILVLAAVGLPALLGWMAPEVLDLSAMADPSAPPLAFRIVLAIAVAVTSIPVIARIFIDLGLQETRFARLVLSASTIEDILLWIALAVAIAIAQNQTADGAQLIRAGMTSVAFLALAGLMGPALVVRLTGARLNIVARASPQGYILLVCFFLAAVAAALDVNVVFGALMAGIIVGRLPDRSFQAVRNGVAEFALAFFIPIYFALVGMKIDMFGRFDLIMVLGFILGSSVVKVGSVALAAWGIGKTLSSALNLGVAMNTRGGPGIVLASVTYEARIISQEFFVALIVAALATSLFSGIWLRAAMAGGRGLYCSRPSVDRNS